MFDQIVADIKALKIQSAINGSQLLLLPKKGHNWPVYWDREAAQAITYQIGNMS